MRDRDMERDMQKDFACLLTQTHLREKLQNMAYERERDLLEE